jgi:predicted DNA-binding WGR domain protein
MAAARRFWHSRAMAKARYFEYVAGTSSKFWSVSQDGNSVTVRFGRIGTDGQIKVKKHADAAKAADDAAKLVKEKVGKGYVEAKPGKAPAAAKPAKPRKPVTKPTRVAANDDDGDDDPVSDDFDGSDPYAAARTTAVFHRIKRKVGKAEGARASFGGRPILAKAQAWPECGTCKVRMSLLLQFDVEKRFGLCFKPGSHLLFFSCLSCGENPPIVSGAKLSKASLDPKSPQSYRVILNPPRVSEVVHDVDPTMQAAPISFTPSPEKLRNGLDCRLGADGEKLGGAPAWTQPPRYIRCACGAPLAFVLQVSEGRHFDWKPKGKSWQEPFYGNPHMVFACSAQCDPYAAVVLVE